MLQFDKKFKAMSDATRLAILRELRDRPRNAGEIAERLGVAPNALSFHLRVLKEADLVSDRREGQYIRYTLNTTVFEDLVTMLLQHFGPTKKDGVAREQQAENGLEEKP